MSRVFSIPTVLRMVPKRLVRQFLDHLGHAALDIPWDGLRERDINPIVEALEGLNATQFDAVESALRAVHGLSCDTGIAAILEAAEMSDDVAVGADMPAEGGLYERAMWAWLRSQEVVTRAALIHEVETLPWWRRRDDLPRGEPNTSPDALDRLGRALSDLLVLAQGRGRVCTVESFARRGTVYFFAHPDDHVQTVTAHDDDRRLAPRTFRRTFPIVFAFTPVEGALELFAKLPFRLKPRVEEAFAGTILGVDLGDWRPDASYELDGLKTENHSLVTDPADHLEVHIRQMRLSLKNSHRQITLRADPEWPGDMDRMLREVLNQEHVPLSAVHVTLVTFCFEFQPVDGRKAGSVTFDVAYPNSCSLRHQPPDRVEIVMKYLQRWGIYAARSIGAGVATPG